MLAIIPFIKHPSFLTSGYLLLIILSLPYFIKQLNTRLSTFGWGKEETSFKLRRINMFIKIINYYIFMAFIPFWVGFYHTNLFAYKKALNNFNFKVVFGIISLISFGWLVFYCFKSIPLFSFGALWFIIFLIPCINIIHSNMIFSERYMYIPLLGFCLLLSQVIVLLPCYQIILAVIITLYFIRTASYSMAYEDEFKLWGINLRNHPKSLEANLNLGDKWIREKRPELAFTFFQRGIELDIESDIAWYNLGVAYCNLGDAINAKKCWEKSLEINPKYISPRFNLLRLEKSVNKQGGWEVIANGEPALLN